MSRQVSLLVLRPDEAVVARVEWLRGEQYTLLVESPADVLILQASLPQLEQVAAAVHDAIQRHKEDAQASPA